MESSTKKYVGESVDSISQQVSTQGTTPVLRVNEIFGPTIQGEGPDAGKPAVFLRLARCNLTCEWCDTRYSWDLESYPEIGSVMDVGEIAERLKREVVSDSTLIVVTGGEPLLQTKGLEALVPLLYDNAIAFETNGTLPPSKLLDEWCSHWTVSPKLENSGVAKELRYRPKVLETFAEMGAAFKFVAWESESFDEIDEIVETHCIEPASVWIMPEGTEGDMLCDVARVIVDDVISRGYNLSMRHQVLIWGDTRGV